MTSDSIHYSGWQEERVNFIFGLSAPRAVLLAVAALMVIMPITAGRLADAAVFWPVAAVLATASFTRIGGRTADEWAVAACSFGIGRLLGHTKYAGGPYAPPSYLDGRNDQTVLDLPGILAPTRLLSIPAAGGRDLAVLWHEYDRTMTAVARVSSPGIGLADSARRDQRVSGWGQLLARMCVEDSPITRIQALQRIVPESGAALRGWHAAHQVPGAPELSTSVARELLDTQALTTRRESYVAVTLDSRKARGQIRAAGGGQAGAATVLVQHLRSMAQAMGGADLVTQDWLGTRDLAEVIRTAFDPASEAALAERRAGAEQAASAGQKWDGAEPGVRPQDAGPVYAASHPGRYEHDGAISTTWYVEEWPHKAWPTILGPLLGDGTYRRSISIIYEPLPPRRAQREVMRERTARQVAMQMRRRTGAIIPEHEREASETALAQDSSRARGDKLVRFTGYLCTTVEDPDKHADACAALEADARQAGLEPRRVWLGQDAAFGAAALPLGLGLPAKRWS